MSLLTQVDQLTRDVAALRMTAFGSEVSFGEGELSEEVFDLYRHRVIRTVEQNPEADFLAVYQAVPILDRRVTRAITLRLCSGGTSPLRRVGKHGLTLRRRPAGVWVEPLERYLSARELANLPQNVHGLSWRTIQDRLKGADLLSVWDLERVLGPAKKRGAGARS